MFTISVCMIVKNEEEVLDRVLSCAKEFADEIVVVDTGSTDKTKEIAQKYTDKIFDFEWCDDFSKARNLSFSKATCDYIMWLDADDFISTPNIQKLVALKTTSDDSNDVFMFYYVMDFINDKSHFKFFRERLVKREKNFQWVGFVHEAISPSGKISYLDIEIEHRKLKPAAPKRNLKIYRNALKNGYKFSPRDQYYYSRELYYNGHYKKGISSFHTYLKMNDNFVPNIIGAYLLICDSYIKVNDFALAKKNVFECIVNHLPNPEVCCMAGKIFHLEQNISQAIFWYESALYAPKQTSGFIQIDYEEFVPYLELCVLYYKIGDIQKSKSYHLRAKKIKPDHPSIISNNQFFKE